MPPFNAARFVFLHVPPTDATTLKGASCHEHGRQVNFVPGGRKLQLRKLQLRKLQRRKLKLRKQKFRKLGS